MDCAEFCQERSDCIYFTVFSGRCYLKSSADGRAANSAASSGFCGTEEEQAQSQPPIHTPVPAPNSPPPSPPNAKTNHAESPSWYQDVSKDCRFEPGTNYQGGTLISDGQHKDGSAQKCAARCLQRIGCNYFSWSSNENCFLKANAGYRKTGQSAWFSGSCVKEQCQGWSCNAIAPNWQDSYAVDGRCYCSFGSHAFDHGIGSVPVGVAGVGTKTVRQICDQIKSKFGTGSANGRTYYNSVACGHAPFNQAGDEDWNACPGRVDIGSRGCQLFGPFWDLAGAYAQLNPMQSTASVGDKSNVVGAGNSKDVNAGHTRISDGDKLKGGLLAVLTFVGVVVLAIGTVVLHRHAKHSAKSEVGFESVCVGRVDEHGMPVAEIDGHQKQGSPGTAAEQPLASECSSLARVYSGSLFREPRCSADKYSHTSKAAVLFV
jgi:hypothetical protein